MSENCAKFATKLKKLMKFLNISSEFWQEKQVFGKNCYISLILRQIWKNLARKKITNINSVKLESYNFLLHKTKCQLYEDVVIGFRDRLYRTNGDGVVSTSFQFHFI